MNILYFLPLCKSTILSADKLPKPLNSLFNGLPITTRQTMLGPDGVPGAVLSYEKNGFVIDVDFNKDKQKWCKSIDGNYWLGYWLDKPPTVEFLSRPVIIEGHKLKVDDNEFVIPVIGPYNSGLPFIEVTKLPKVYERRLEDVYESVAPGYEEACKLSEEWMTRINKKEIITVRQAWDFCVKILNINYYLLDDEVNLLKLFRSENIGWITETAIGLREIEEEIGVRKSTTEGK